MAKPSARATFLKPLQAIVMLYLLWELTAWLFAGWPSPRAVGSVLIAQFQQPAFREALLGSATRMLIGYSLVVVLGVTAGLLLGRLPLVDQVMGSLAVAVHAIPGAAGADVTASSTETDATWMGSVSIIAFAGGAKEGSRLKGLGAGDQLFTAVLSLPPSQAAPGAPPAYARAAGGVVLAGIGLAAGLSPEDVAGAAVAGGARPPQPVPGPQDSGLGFYAEPPEDAVDWAMLKVIRAWAKTGTGA